MLAWGLAATAAASQDRPVGVYPIPGLFGPEASACPYAERREATPSVRIAPQLCNHFELGGRAAWGQRFSARVATRFSNVRGDLSAPPPAGVARETVLSETLIASLHVSRADIWQVEKVSTLDVYLPITLTLMLTNAQTGEVVFSETQTTIIQGAMTAAGYQDQISREFPDHFAKAIDGLVDKAAARFKPYPIKATVRGRADTYFVVDAGRRRGLREGDFLGTDARVRYADANYALVEPLLGKIAPGQTLSRQVAQPVESLQKPSAMVFVSGETAGLPGDYLTTVLEDALAASSLSVAPVNASFARIRDDAIGDAGVAHRPRALPDYFVRLSVIGFEPVETETNVRGVRRRVQEARALVEVLDRQGRVVFAAQGLGRTVDEVVEGMTFSSQQRRDTVVRNAIVEAADKIAKGFRPQRLRLAAGPDPDGISFQDPTSLLSPGQRGMLMRKVGAVDGVDGVVWRPLADIEVTRSDRGRGAGRIVGLQSASARQGDELAYDAGGPGGGGQRLIVMPCLTNTGALRVDQRGQTVQGSFGPLAANVFAANFPGAVYFADTAAILERRMSGQFERLDELGALRSPRPNACFEAVNKLTATGEHRSGAAVATDYDVTVGFILWDGGRRLGASALQSVLTATAMPSATPPAGRDLSLQMDFASETSKLAAQAAAQLRPGQ